MNFGRKETRERRRKHLPSRESWRPYRTPTTLHCNRHDRRPRYALWPNWNLKGAFCGAVYGAATCATPNLDEFEHLYRDDLNSSELWVAGT